MFKRLKYFEKEAFYNWMTLLFLLGQWIIIAVTSVNVPAGDEWESLRENAFPNGFTWNYVFDFHNEHRIVFTKLLNFIFLYTTGWNIQYQVIFNYLIFCGLVGLIVHIQRKFIPMATKGIWCLPFFLASPLLVDNLNWAFQSQFHFFLVFGILSVFVVTRDTLRPIDAIASSLLALCAVYSFSAGMFFGAMIFTILCYRLFVLSQKNSATFYVGLLSLIILLSGIAGWFTGYHKPQGHPDFVFPYELDFWNFWANLVSLGFGYKSTNFIFAVASVLIVVVALVKNFKTAFSFKKRFVSIAFFSTLVILAILMSITLSRASYGIGQAKTSRYAEIGIFLMIFSGWLWWSMAKSSEAFAKLYKYFIWFVVIGFLGNYSYGTYFSVAEDRQAALICIGKYYSGENKTGDCPILYPAPISKFLDRAKALKLSWVPESN